MKTFQSPSLIEHRSTRLFGIIGLTLFCYSLFAALFRADVTWYSYFVVGGTLALAYVNHVLGNESLLDRISSDKQHFFRVYALYLVSAVLIETVGRFWLRLWEYPSFSRLDELIHVFLIGYPFGLFFVYESLILIRQQVKSFGLTILLATMLNAFLAEIPNTFAWEWRYTIPYITLEILRINVVVIAGWVILVAVTLVVNRIVH